MNINNEIESYNVSRETKRKLGDFVALLREWNEKMNLVSKKSLEEVWERHVLDSMQLIKYIYPDDLNLVDIGSGSGFPAIVLAILLQEINPKSKLTLVESITKKTVYLNDVRLRLGLDNVEIKNIRVENGVFKNVDLITARAVASLSDLFGYSFTIGNKKTRMLFPKGKSYKEEENEANKSWIYNREVHLNCYYEDGVILEVTNLRKRK